MIASPRPPTDNSSTPSGCVTCSPALEPAALVDDLDHQLVRVQLVRDRDRAAAGAVRVAHGVRARLGQGELDVAEHLRRELLRAQAREAGEGEPPQRDVLGLRRDRQANRVHRLDAVSDRGLHRS